MKSSMRTFIMENILDLLLSIPKTIWFNFKVLPINKALKLPFIVSFHVKIKGVNRDNFIVKKNKLPFASMRIGFGKSDGSEREKPTSMIKINKKGKIVLNGKVGLSQGFSFIVKDATLTLGDNFRCNYSTVIDCSNSDITIGNECVCGWKVTIRNSDGHCICENRKKKPVTAPIVIGNHVWLCANSTVLKGCNIGNDSVLAYGALLTKSNYESNVLYAGTPAKIVRREIGWFE